MVSTEDCHSKGRGIESRSFLFLLFVSGPREKKRKTTNCEPKRRDATEKGGSGEMKKKDRQAFQENGLRERCSVRFEDD